MKKRKRSVLEESKMPLSKRTLAAIRKAKEGQDKELYLGGGHAYDPNERLNQIPLEVFELKDLEVLDLRDNALTEIPDAIGNLQNLKSLDLSGNNLHALASSIGQLRKLMTLKELRLRGDSFSYQYSGQIPSELFELKQLEVLDLRDNALTEIPDAIASLQNLKSLDLSGNKLSSLPDSIERLKKLDMLNLYGNKLSAIPEVICRMSKLQRLFLGGNELSELPGELSQLSHLRHLTIGMNLFREVPQVVFELTALQNLSIGCRVAENIKHWKHNADYWQIHDLPLEIIQLKNLKELDLSANTFKLLPTYISQLSHLTALFLDNNRFSEIPKVIYSMSQLEQLSLANEERIDTARNSIKEISPQILELKNLRELDLEGNNIKSPPPEVVSKGVDGVKDYFRQIEAEGQDYLYEAKLLIIGEGGAGKTTLAKKIQNPDYELQDEGSTKGIEVIRWQFPMENGRKFQVNIWDFGGQEIYHATHQFFLTKRSLYALVADARKEDTDFYYWLNVVELLSDNSPLLIIKNEKQDRHREINERQLRGQFTNLEETLATNLATNRGLPEILNEIKHHIGRLPLVGSPLPKTWVKVRKALEHSSHNYISINEYFKVCQRHGFKDNKDKLQLSGYLHDLGVCLHFQDDPLLRKTVILKPKWGTDAVYKALDNSKIIRNLGLFTRADLMDIWDAPEYAGMQDELLQLMMKFKLCYRIPDTQDTFIAPQLLGANQPIYDWDQNNNLYLRYTFEFMPKGILTQFIVAMHHMIAAQRLVWKSGVVLEKDQTHAEVIEYYDKREIKIRISGKRKKDLLIIVMYELDQICRSYRRLQYTKLIPCNCSACKASHQDVYFYPLETLLKFIEDKQNDIQCQKSYKMVDVFGLVDDVLDTRKIMDEAKKASQGVVFQGPVGQVIVQQTEEGDNIVSKKSKDEIVVKSAWANGSFYLFTFAVVVVGLGVLARTLPLYTLALVLIAGLLFVPIVGALQLRQDDRLSEKSFIELVKMVFGQLPLIGKLGKQNKKMDGQS